MQPPPLQQDHDAAEHHLQQPFQFGQQPAPPNFDAADPVAPAVQQLPELAVDQPLLPLGPQFAFAVLGDSDSSSEDDRMQPAAAELRFVKGDATLGERDYNLFKLRKKLEIII